MRPLILKCPVQHYDWGKVGSDSLVAQLAGLSGDKATAELWMGAHTRAPATVNIDGEERSLDAVIAADPIGNLGGIPVERFGNTLPFLFKVLSIAKPLSIQAHPTKEHARRLNERDPKNYPDANHKPEIAIALTPVEALAGFRHVASIIADFRRLSPLESFFSKEVVTALSAAPAVEGALHDLLRKRLTEEVLLASADKVAKTVEAIVQRLQGIGADRLTDHDRWFQRSLQHFATEDSGLLWFYLLHIVNLAPGESIFLAPNIAHAYLSGDLVECMANSDNVVRVGLTPKFLDKDTLLGMLDYSAKVTHDTGVVATDSPDVHLRYVSPTMEFAVDRFSTPQQRVMATKSANIVLCVAGRGAIVSGTETMAIEAGTVAFVPASVGYTLNLSDGITFVASVPA